MEPVPPPNTADGGPLGAGIDWADPNSPLAPLYLTPSGVLAAAALGLAVVIFGAVPLWHTDFWAHRAYGRVIAGTRAVPAREPLSPFTDQSARMFDVAWLTQLGYHGLMRAGGAVARGDERRQLEGGVELVRLAHLLAAVATVGLVGLACGRATGSTAWAAGAMLFVLVAMPSPLSVQRPQAFGLTCYAALLCGLARPVPTRRAVAWVPLLMVLWANLHGSFAVGFALLGLVLVGRAVEAHREGGSVAAAWRTRAVRRLLAALALALAAVAALNPYGPSLFVDVVQFGGHPNLKAFGEWQPLDFSRPRGGHWLYLATLVALAAAQAVSPRPLAPTALLLVLTLGVWPLFQQRAMVWWVPLVPCLAAPHLIAAGGRWGWRLPASAPDFRRTVLAALLVGLSVFVSPASAWAKTGQPRPVPAALHRGTPYDVAAALRGDPPADPGRVEGLVRKVREWHGGRYSGRVFASETQGEYLLGALPDDAPPMMYGHGQLFPPAYWSECLTVKAGGPGWWEVLDRYRAGAVVVEADLHPRLCDEVRKHPGWAVVVDEAAAPARDPYARLFVALRKPDAPATPTTP